MAVVQADAHLAADAAGQFYRQVAETIPHMVWAARPDGALDFFNSRVYEYTGLGYAGLEGWSWKDLVHQDDRQHCLAVWTRALQTGERYEVEYRLRRADGAYRWHSGTAMPIRDGAGRLLRWIGTCTDIEDQIRGAQILEQMVGERTRALEQSEQRFRLFMEHLPLIAWVRDADLRYTYVNRLFAKDRGVEPEDALGQPAAAFFPAEVAERFIETDRRAQREGAPLQFVESVPALDGGARRWLKIKFPLPDAQGGRGVAGIALDITERAQLEDALRESERRFQAFMENAPLVAWAKDSARRYVYVNPAYRTLYQMITGDVLGKTDADFADPETTARRRADDDHVLDTGRPVQWVRKLRSLQGTEAERDWLIVKFPLTDPNGGPGVGGIAIDISERVQAEELARRYAAEIRSLMNRLVATREMERRRLADELHDLIGQNLTALGIELAALDAGLPKESRAGSAPRLEDMRGLLAETVAAIRGVMTDLRPPALEEYGLVAAMRSHALEHTQRTGMKVSVGGPAELRLVRETELVLFRIFQEALTNATKHSGGSLVQASICAVDGATRLVVEDDGRGFADPLGARREQRGGWGLRAMRERAQAHGGALRIEFPGRGTRLVVEIPDRAD